MFCRRTIKTLEHTIHRQDTLINGAGQEAKGAFSALQKELEKKTAEWDTLQAHHQEHMEAWEHERLQLQTQLHLAQSSLESVNTELVAAKHRLGSHEATIQELEYAPFHRST